MTTISISRSEARDLYRAGNNAGEGYAPDEESVDDAATALAAETTGEVIYARHTSDDVAVVRCGDGDLIAIGGDAMGGNAWAVKIGTDNACDECGDCVECGHPANNSSGHGTCDAPCHRV